MLKRGPAAGTVQGEGVTRGIPACMLARLTMGSALAAWSLRGAQLVRQQGRVLSVAVRQPPLSEEVQAGALL